MAETRKTVGEALSSRKPQVLVSRSQCVRNSSSLPTAWGLLCEPHCWHHSQKKPFIGVVLSRSIQFGDPLAQNRMARSTVFSEEVLRLRTQDCRSQLKGLVEAQLASGVSRRYPAPLPSGLASRQGTYPPITPCNDILMGKKGVSFLPESMTEKQAWDKCRAFYL